ncbi:MAG: hypothetical protein M5U08_16800 [Burkholderiales bacterium]|nr:hypothetical protein [Burkholderiales bacterium]
MMFNFFRQTGQSVAAMLRRGWLRILIERMNNVHLLRQRKLGKFIARLPATQGLKMGWAMVFRPRTRSWGRTGEVLREYVEEQKRAAHAKLSARGN